MFIRSTRVYLRLKEFERVNNIILDKDEYTWQSDDKQCLIIDIDTDYIYNNEKVINKINDFIEIKNGPFIIIIADLNHINLNNLEKIVNINLKNNLIIYNFVKYIDFNNLNIKKSKIIDLSSLSDNYCYCFVTSLSCSIFEFLSDCFGAYK
jgi:hypothetical protein